MLSTVNTSHERNITMTAKELSFILDVYNRLSASEKKVLIWLLLEQEKEHSSEPVSSVPESDHAHLT